MRGYYSIFLTVINISLVCYSIYQVNKVDEIRDQLNIISLNRPTTQYIEKPCVNPVKTAIKNKLNKSDNPQIIEGYSRNGAITIGASFPFKTTTE